MVKTETLEEYKELIEISAEILEQGKTNHSEAAAEIKNILHQIESSCVDDDGHLPEAYRMWNSGVAILLGYRYSLKSILLSKAIEFELHLLDHVILKSLPPIEEIRKNIIKRFYDYWQSIEEDQKEELRTSQKLFLQSGYKLGLKTDEIKAYALEFHLEIMILKDKRILLKGCRR